MVLIAARDSVFYLALSPPPNVCAKFTGGEVVNVHVSISISIKEFIVSVCGMCSVCYRWLTV